MTLIKDLIDIPERVQKGDFVLRLTEGVTRPEETLRHYVVTPELKDCFDQALTFIRSALQANSSKATYLHGSFGSGKSHFMAVLHLILQGNIAARSIKPLAPIVTKHNDWITGKKFLLVPYHMIGALNMESGILGGYADFIRHAHPDAPIPGIYQAEGLFQDAQALRDRMGDPDFFAALNESSSSGWGELDAGWNADRFDIACATPPKPRDERSLTAADKAKLQERQLLVGILVKTFFKNYQSIASGEEESYISLDQGLSVLSQHAKSLGYDGLILFLDELVLWLASRATDLAFIHQEGQKLAKLVEAQTADRPIPIISFVARQRDLGELVGDTVPGADRLNFGDALKHWEGRFDRINLEDRNLPAIAEQRILKCKTPSAREQLDTAFEQTKMRDSVMNTLLTREGDREMFRQVYPFSPALVQTLIAVSSVLQRERTALKVMMQLLVDQRENLSLGDIVPVGDLFDVIAHGDEAFSPEMAIHFNNAKRLYHQKLLPLLEKQQGIRQEDLATLSPENPTGITFRNHDRLIKTLLLAALVPEVESLRALNAERLAALNHGTIKTPIAGREGAIVLNLCKTWAASVGEIRVSEEQNPSISIQLSGVETESIIEQARNIDSRGNQIQLLRQMIFNQLTIAGEDELEQYRTFEWRGTKRTCTILFKNIRELPDLSLENDGDRWKLIIDFPFEDGHGPRDDIGRLDKFKADFPDGAKTLCWVPAFFSHDAQKDLGMLVILEHILTGDRFSQYATRLSPQDRQAAKSLLENQRSVLRQRVQNHIDAAYGLESLSPDSLDPVRSLELHERFVSLYPGFDLQPPVAARLEQALEHLHNQAMEFEFPAAPYFEAEVYKISNLEKVYQVILAAAQIPDGRIPVEKNLRPLLRQIANPLRLGEMGHDATHFVLGQDWKTHFIRKAEGKAITIRQMRDWINEPKAMGLPKEVQNLVILAFAEQTHRTFFRHSTPIEPTLKEMWDECELREQNLPDEAQWQRAVQRAESIFGIQVAPLRKVSTVLELEAKVTQCALIHPESTQKYAQNLQTALSHLKLDDQGDRLKTATLTQVLLEQISATTDNLVNTLAALDLSTSSEAALKECWSKAASLSDALEKIDWEIFELIAQLTDDRQLIASDLLKTVEQALCSDEHVITLISTLKAAQTQARQLFKTVAPLPPSPSPVNPNPAPAPSPAPQPTPTPKRGKQTISRGSKENLELSAAQELLSELTQNLQPEQTARLSISWIIESGESS